MRDEPTRPDPANPTGDDHAAQEASTLANGHGAGGPVTADPQVDKDGGEEVSSPASRDRGDADPDLAAGGDDI